MKKEMIKVWTFALLALSFTGGIDAESAGEEKEVRPWLLSVTTNTGSWSSSDVDNSGGQTVGYFQMAYDSKNWGAAVTGKAGGSREISRNMRRPAEKSLAAVRKTGGASIKS